MTHKTYNVSFRRKRFGKTNYRKRLKILKSRVPRLVVTPSNKNILLQVVSYQPEGDKSLLTVSSQILNKKFGWKFSRCNIPSAYLTGLIAGKELSKKGIKKAILDIGFSSSTKGS
ncbi:MAG: 50S ribosomal protein L18, partial [Candidatus Dadabacteria bacterium]|nr:50S ribosomal protein L18 [Candidatus Dadabacteria bacterium]